MSCWKQQDNAIGCGGNAGNAMDDDNRWSLGDEEESHMGEGSSQFKKHNWTLVHAQMNIGTEEAICAQRKL